MQPSWREPLRVEEVSASEYRAIWLRQTNPAQGPQVSQKFAGVQPETWQLARHRYQGHSWPGLITPSSIFNRAGALMLDG